MGQLVGDTMEAAGDVDCTQEKIDKKKNGTIEPDSETSFFPLLIFLSLSRTGFLPSARLPLHRKDLSTLIRTKQTFFS
jgi:hypothetical protein